jgi:hypothetical protein
MALLPTFQTFPQHPSAGFVSLVKETFMHNNIPVQKFDVVIQI